MKYDSFMVSRNTAHGRTRTATIVAALLLAACSSDQERPQPGTERGPCYGNGTCNPGLTCASEICVKIADSGGGDPPRPDSGTGPEPDASGTDAGAPDAGGTDTATGDAAVACPDEHEPNETCAEAKPIGTAVAEKVTSWITIDATSGPAGDVDWYGVVGKGSTAFCVPDTDRCHRLTVHLDVPGSHKLELCVLRDDCEAEAACADNATGAASSPVQVSYQRLGKCALVNDTEARIAVRQLDDHPHACAPYTLEVAYELEDC